MIILALLGFGIYLVYLGFSAAADKAQPAAKVRLIGFSLIAAAFAIYVIRWLIRRWIG
ncbi:MAG: hypothetical protein ACYTG0_24275 [Planctomycetota bacterium]|jgi:hypothetical protein